MDKNESGDFDGQKDCEEEKQSILPHDSREDLSDRFPIVGIGASAGGLAAFEAFFSGLPSETDLGMAFVLVQHLAPDRKSLLSEIISRNVQMDVIEIDNGMKVKKNCIYVVPPGKDVAIVSQSFSLLEPSAARGHRMPIDFFFRSLALDQKEFAVGVILSGTGSDGTLGVRAIKGEGGMVMVQSPAGTEYDSMPQAALATGLADYSLPPDEMASHLISYIADPNGTEIGDRLEDDSEDDTAEGTFRFVLFRQIFALLRSQTGHDFSLYKKSTIERRIERRITVNKIENLESYVHFLQSAPGEIESLFQDLLIGVTCFFRDPEAFEELERKVIPAIFHSRPEGSTIRVWCAGCSTGEEAYSIAILIAEYTASLKKDFKIQIFATDINSQSITIARAGIYPASISADISSERLAKFFTVESDESHFRIRKSIRDMLVFSEQDLVRDPPFSKIDLLSCRNLLIYFGVELKKKLIPIFHYSINPGGFLFLGASSGVGDNPEMFTQFDRKTKIFIRKSDLFHSRKNQMSRFGLIEKSRVPDAVVGSDKTNMVNEQSLKEAAEQGILRLIAPSAAIVNWQGDIHYVYGRTGMFLEPAPGEVRVNNILTMAREGLRPSLSATLNKAVGSKFNASCQNVMVKTNGHYSPVNITISPIASTAGEMPESKLYLVLFEISKTETASIETPSRVLSPEGSEDELHKTKDVEVQIELLMQELHAKEEYIQAAQEELASSNEELNASLEEMQSVNEELQSSNEELETSKEELQSVNEELSTVNAELQVKVMDLSRANDDMNNLLAGTGIGTVFVDHQMRVLRFTPPLSGIFNLIATDIGRPITHIASNLIGYDRLMQDTQSVLNTLTPSENEVQVKDGKWYTMRIQPYRTIENVIEGAVITFVEITARKLIEEALRKTNDLSRLAVVVRDANDAITVQELNGRIIAWNPGAVKLYGWTEEEALKLNLNDRIPADLRDEELNKLRRLSLSEVLEPYDTQRIDRNGKVMQVTMVSTALLNASEHVYAIATTERVKGVPRS